ncbi:MAG TPA: GUN4 domain-containing protein [Nostoc sp.]|uniref:GUN4 domain-containing protein n=1 Tax=Nostoc sp. TaxID=1180 RepID=UPI002D4D5E80|nr:GUN4 domain-containing protein [Nostoc sp.]HYX13802.1 GUN4 domain-containing protein [Nostoc sp.]
MEKFDVFLCHNSNDKPAVIGIAKQLQQQRIVPWLDIWHLRPGFSWQRALEQQIDQIGAAAVFVGGSGFGPWQSQEIDAFLREFVNRQCPVIPVLLPDAPQEPKLPVFLQGLMWVDFRLQYPEPLGQLMWGITGEKPGTTPIIQPTAPQADNLDSEKGINYTRLRDLLAAKNWKEADQETYRVMIQAVDKKYGDYFTPDELLNFPCTDLRTIDRLWVKYSDGHFGFSVQKEIYLSVGGKADGKYYKEAWEKFGDRVGWLKINLISSVIKMMISSDRKWVNSDVQFDTASPRGHLPTLTKLFLAPGLGLVGGEFGGWSTGLFSRI